jgi:predicted NUDIX family NTP pyrophosphohydrolase
MASTSAGILLYRDAAPGTAGGAAPGAAGIEVFLGHMGGPFWARKDAAAWSIPKGIVEPGEAALATALREFEEEIGSAAPGTQFVPLGDFRYASGKVVTVFAARADGEVVFAPRSTVTVQFAGRTHTFPELDRVLWCPVDVARERLVKGQRPVLDALAALLSAGSA